MLLLAGKFMHVELFDKKIVYFKWHEKNFSYLFYLVENLTFEFRKSVHHLILMVWRID